MWQFMPSYIWPDVFRAIELTKCARRHRRRSRPHGDCRRSRAAIATRSMWEQAERSLRGRAGWIDSARCGRGRPRARDARCGIERPRHQGARASRLAERASRAAWAPASGATRPARNGDSLRRTIARHWVGDPARPGESYDEQLSPLLAAPQRRRLGRGRRGRLPLRRAPDIDRSGSADAGAGTQRCALAPLGDAPGGPQAAPPKVATTCGAWRVAADSELRRSEPRIRRRPARSRPSQETSGAASARRCRECMAMRSQARAMLEAERPDAPDRHLRDRAVQRGTADRGCPRRNPEGRVAARDDPRQPLRLHARPTSARIRASGDLHDPAPTCVWGEVWKRDADRGRAPIRRTSVPRHRQLALRRHRRLGRGPPPGGPPARWASTDGRDARPRLQLGPGDEAELVIGRGPMRSGGGVHAAAAASVGGPRGDRRGAYAQPGGPRDGIRAGALADVLAAASIVVSQLSTVIAEAILADRPVVVADFAEQEGWSLYKDSAGMPGRRRARRSSLTALARVRSDAELRRAMSLRRAELIETACSAPATAGRPSASSRRSAS